MFCLIFENAYSFGFSLYPILIHTDVTLLNNEVFPKCGN